VIVYPTSHEGGEFVLRHKDRGWKFDPSDLTSSQSSPSLAYIAFYGGIERETLKVISGHLVTVTYNLYLVNPVPRPRTSALAPDLKNVSNLRTTLQRLLESPEFLPNGGTLGFGLAHLYPVTLETKLQEMEECLKGEDAACRELQLQPSLKMIYDDSHSEPGLRIVSERISRGPSCDCMNGRHEITLMRDLGGVPVNRTEGGDPSQSYWVYETGIQGEFITWISPFNGRNQLQFTGMRDVDEDEYRKDDYCSPCVVARVAPASDRV